MFDDYFLRKVKRSDVKDLFSLSNEDYVRKYSIDKSEIEWLEHVKWFENIISSDEYIFYVVSDKKDNFLGQIRYEINDEIATVSISLSKALKGKGLSVDLLTKSIKELKDDRIEVQYILAIISDNNQASKRLFEKANFSFLKDNVDGMKEYILQIK